ncbi:MAG: hypothetical protein AB9M53_01450 [Leptothrix sp. (in: b-proteobacteria)]
MQFERARRELAPRHVPTVNTPRAIALAPATLNSGRERGRRQLVAVVMLIYLLAIFEGSIRKYLLPGLGAYVFFVRDPFVLIAFVLASRHRLWPAGNLWLTLTTAMAGLGVLLLVLQIALFGVDNLRLILGVYGWRGYFYYLPLAFLIGAQFQAADLQRLMRWTLWLAAPIALLVALQYFSPMDATINVGVAEEKELQFKGMGLNATRIRPSGPFTSNLGQTQFVATACALVLAGLIAPAGFRRVRPWLLLVGAAAVMVCVALGGSRGTMLQALLTVVFAMGIGLVGRGAAMRSKALVLPLVLAGVATLLYPIVFPDGFTALMARFDAAGQAEASFEGGVFGRALFGLVDFIRLIDSVPPLGYGLGYGGNASITLGAMVDGVAPGTLVETDFARHMVDLGPALGLAYIAFRVALVLWIGRQVWRVTQQRSDPLPMMLYAYVSYTVLLGQISGNGSINAYGWLFTGFCMAAVRTAR